MRTPIASPSCKLRASFVEFTELACPQGSVHSTTSCYQGRDKHSEGGAPTSTSLVRIEKPPGYLRVRDMPSTLSPRRKAHLRQVPDTARRQSSRGLASTAGFYVPDAPDRRSWPKIPPASFFYLLLRVKIETRIDT